ncbi:MAG: hypothetical protein WCP34_17425 [Pseudomonadota bacterium]
MSLMKSTKTYFALLCCLGLFALPAQAIVTCSQTVAPAVPFGNPPSTEASQIARLLAGMDMRNVSPDPMHGQYVTAVNDGWQAFMQNLGNPLHAWASREVPRGAGQTVFYPFSGPDLPSVLAIYPAATHFVMISDQYATRYFDPFALNEPDQTRVVQALGESWTRFGRLGFFLTQDLNKNGGQKYHLSPSMILMAFAVRLGYEVRSVRPTCLDPSNLTIRTLDAKDARWGSVRLELRKDGRDIVVDYLQQDLSDRGLAKRPEVRGLIDSITRGPVLMKAASHLPQKPGFSILRNAILTYSPLVVQDETGLEYDAMANRFNVQLYGVYVGAYRLFKEDTNPSLVKAYRNRAQDVRPLDFRLGYEKEAGSAIQVATRK